MIRRTRSLLLLLALITGVGLGAPLTASAAALDWTGATSGAWSDPTNWSPASVPAPLDDVTIPAGTPHAPAITAGEDVTVDDLRLAPNATLTITGTMTAGLVALEEGSSILGTDTISGGPGNDIIVVNKDGKRDRIACGRGRDIVYASRIDRVAADCECVVRTRH